MKILKALMLSLMLTLSLGVNAEEGTVGAGMGERADCGQNSTCSECVNQSTAPEESTYDDAILREARQREADAVSN